MSNNNITVIIPTLCGTKRSNELVRAIKSIHNQIDVNAKILVIVNGNQYDKNLLNIIKNKENVHVLLIDKAGIAHARYVGRQHVETAYFLFLDDDDELYPFSLKELLNTFNVSDNKTGVVISDAFSSKTGKKYGFIASIKEIEENPLNALLKQNWLIIQSALFKKELTPTSLFNIQTQSNECTILAFNLALANIKIKVNNKPLAIIHDSTHSESKTEHFITQEPEVLGYMLKMDTPKNFRKKLKQKLSNAYHHNSVYYLKKNMFKKSLLNHLQSLGTPQGFKFFFYSRYILLNFLKFTIKKNNTPSNQ